jgi:hypothetical protein
VSSALPKSAGNLFWVLTARATATTCMWLLSVGSMVVLLDHMVGGKC